MLNHSSKIYQIWYKVRQKMHNFNTVLFVKSNAKPVCAIIICVFTMGNKGTKMSVVGKEAIKRGDYQGIPPPPVGTEDEKTESVGESGVETSGVKADGKTVKANGVGTRKSTDAGKGDQSAAAESAPPKYAPAGRFQTNLVALAKLQESQNLIANEITTQIHEWIENATIQWRNGVEVCDIMGITRNLDFSSNDNTVRREGGLDSDDCCIIVYNRTAHPIFVQSEFLPGYRRRLNKLEVGATVAPGAGTGTLGFEIGEVKVEAINLERLIVFPGKLTLIQVGSREQSFITVDIVYNKKEINLYTDKKMYYAQCLVIGGEPIDEKTLVSCCEIFVLISVC